MVNIKDDLSGIGLFVNELPQSSIALFFLGVLGFEAFARKTRRFGDQNKIEGVLLKK